MAGQRPAADDEHYSEAETVARREAALKRMLSTPHKANPKREPVSTGAKRGRPPKARTEVKDSHDRFANVAARKPKAVKGKA